MRSVISIDLGATNLRVGLLTEKLKIVKVLRERTTKSDPLKLYDQIKDMLEKVLEDVPSDIEYPHYVGVSACGFTENDFIIKLPNLFIQSFDLKHHIEKDFPELEVFIANDANAAAYTESVFGAASEVKTSFFITVSSGLGGCLVYNHELIDLPFEIGHMGINYQNKFYEVEQLLSGNGLVRLAKLNKLNIDSSSDLFDLVENKDSKALKVYDDWLKYLGTLIGSLQLMFSTDLFVLSGGVMKSRRIFEDDLRKIAEAYTAPYSVKPIKFVQAKFDQDAGLIGGAGLALRHLDD